MRKNKILLYALLSGFSLLTACSETEIRVETGDVTGILTTSAEVAGHILCAGDGIKQFGHCYSVTPNPTVDDFKTELGVAIGTGRYTSNLYYLEPGVKYYVKAYAMSNKIIAYGSEVSFTTKE